MRIIDTHAHLGDIYGTNPGLSIEERNQADIDPDRPNIYEKMGYRNIYFGRLNYLFKPLIAGSAKKMAAYGNIPNLADSMKSNNISTSVVVALEPHVRTETVLKACRNDPRFIPFCSVHPKDKEKSPKLRQYISAGCRGLKIHPVIQEVAPDDPATLELLEEIKPYNVPVLLHAGWGAVGKGKYGFTEHYKKLLDSFPDLTIILAHMGFYEPLPLLEMIKERANVYVDTSWQPDGIIRKALEIIGPERILLGSDWPFSRQSTSLKIVMKMTEKDPGTREMILHKNAERIIKA